MQRPAVWDGMEHFMWDLGCLAASIAFFLIAIAYATACEKLSGAKEGK